MSDPMFDTTLDRVISEYADRGVRPVDRRAIAQQHRGFPDLGTAASDLLRRTVTSRQAGPGHLEEVFGDRFRERRVHG